MWVEKVDEVDVDGGVVFLERNAVWVKRHHVDTPDCLIVVF